MRPHLWWRSPTIGCLKPTEAYVGLPSPSANALSCGRLRLRLCGNCDFANRAHDQRQRGTAVDVQRPLGIVPSIDELCAQGTNAARRYPVARQRVGASEVGAWTVARESFSLAG